MKNLTFLSTILLLTAGLHVNAQQTKVDLSKISSTYNRNITSVKGSPVIKVNEAAGSGVAWLRLKDVTNATIEIELKGNDQLQRSFLGIAFHGQNDSTYEAIYFRPFNFKAADPARASHAVQYISLPGNDWPKLRETEPGKYEQPINVSLDPNDWFKARIVLNNGQISVYLNDVQEPSLKVNSLSAVKPGKIGLWTGNNSPGEFRNMQITR